MTKLVQNIFLLLLGMLMLASCGTKPKGVENPKPSVYYWRTTFALDSEERAFLSANNVGKMYLHLFDVVKEPNGDLHPSGTLLFKDQAPAGIEVIPVVFIAPGALKECQNATELSQLIVRRVDEMLKQNAFPEATEIQIDYDWVQSDQQAYFQLLKSIQDLLHSQNRKLSTTIRLHQLALPVPPADYGVLMVYNTGNLTKKDEPNSILSVNAVGPYLHRLHDYDLPLCAALPIYSWDLLFHTGHFVQIVKGVDVTDTKLFTPIDRDHYRCQSYMPAPANGVVDNEDQRIFPGDVIRHEWVPMATFRKVKAMLEDKRPGICDQTVIYHLDNKSLKQYKPHEIQEFFSEP